MVKFTDLKISQSIVKAITNMGFEELTPIQEKAIPLAMEGKDLIGHAQTGTGKTAAFGIPMIESIRPTSRTVQGLVVAPTRELAVQVTEELNRIGQVRGIRTVPIYGGQDFRTQLKAIATQPHIIVGTPGRLLEHLRRQIIRTNDIKIAVLDEADIMLDMGFIDDIEKIFSKLPDKRQTMLFSATISPAVQKLAHRYLIDPVMIELGNKSITVPNTEQFAIEVSERDKFETLTRLIDSEHPELAIVFVRTRIRVDELATALAEHGFNASGIHGDLIQSKRESTLGKFRSGKTDILVATDVAARGLDIQGVTHIYNYDIPQDSDSYIHRIGRTGRAGKTGIATTLYAPREGKLMNSIERTIDRKITEKPIPSGAEATGEKIQSTIEKINGEIEKQDLTFYKGFAENMLKENDSVALVAAALRLLSKVQDRPPVKLTEPKPRKAAPAKKPDQGGRGKAPSYGKTGGRSKGYGHKDESARGKEESHKPAGRSAPHMGSAAFRGNAPQGGSAPKGGHGPKAGSAPKARSSPKGSPFKQFMKKPGAGKSGGKR